MASRRSTPSSPPTMEPSQSSSLDAVIPSSPIDSLGLIREMYSDEDSEELNSSESMNPSHHASPPSSPTTMEPSYSSPAGSVHPSPPMDAAASVRELCQHIDPLDHIDPLVSFVKNHLQKMTTPLEAESSSQEGWIQTVRDSTKLAAQIIKTISTEADEISNSDAIKTVENVTSDVMKGVKDLYWVFIGLSVAAYAVENYFSVASTERECRDHLLNILKLAKGVHGHNIRLPDERNELCKAVKTIVEGAIIFCDYLTLKREKICRFLSAETAAAQLEKANRQVMEVTDSLASFSLDRHWDVFLSHSGKQKNFARQLHRDITGEHVSCFFDEDPNCLPPGKKFHSLMLKAAKKCNIAVVVISNEFLCSKWPMMELSAFVSAINSGDNANLIILPIFFKISARILSRIPKDKPEWENLDVSNDTKDKWVYALKEVRPTQGLEFREGGNEVRCRDEVVKKISWLLRGNKPPKLLEFQPVGIEGQVTDVKALLDMEGALSALAVIVHGFGGVGKSTVAAAVVESLDWSSMDVKFCRVAIDEKTSNKTSHVIQLQKHIIYKLGGKLDFQDDLEGRIEIKKALQKKNCLLFIDNVVDKDYIRDLLPKDFQSGDQETKLRIIITSREKTVKAELDITCKCNEYEVKGLSHADSERLLMDSIVQSQMVEEDEKCMINEVAVACGGVPLLLSVFGKHLRVDRNKESYEDALKALKKGNPDSYADEDLSTRLMFVYHKIKDMEVKEAFLDISTYFYGWQWNLVADIVDADKLNALHSRTLVSKSGSDEVIVHDILRLMGMKEAEQTRFSNYKNLSVFLEDNNLDVLGNVKGIKLVNNTHVTTIKSTQLEAMHKSLRVLILGDWVILDGPPCNNKFRNLRYLSLGDISAFPFKNPSKLDNLKVFSNRSYPGTNLSQLPSSLKQISHGVRVVGKFVKLPYQNLSSLKSLSIQRETLPENVHLPPSLIYLNLLGCKNLPKDISHLTALESLILDECDLKCMPQGFGKLTKLKSLSLNWCTQLAFLPEEVGMLSSLETFSMQNCNRLRALPNKKDEDDDYDGIRNFILSICDEQSSRVAGQSKTEEFVEALKASGIDHLDYAGQQVMVDDLHGKTIGVIICKLNHLKSMKVTEIYKDFQEDSNFIVIAIPSDLAGYRWGIGSYTMVIQPMRWATILHPKLDNYPYKYDHFVVLDKEGHIAFRDASLLVWGWGLKFYPFTQDSIRQSLLMMESESWTEILFHGMNIVERKAMKSKMTFLCTVYQGHLRNKPEQLLTKIRGDFEVLYVGNLTGSDYWDFEDVKQKYEDATKNMRVPSLSVGDHFLFWNRCRYLAREESHIMMQTLHELAKRLSGGDGTSLVLVDNDGVVTFKGEDVLEMIYKPSFGIWYNLDKPWFFDTSDGEGKPSDATSDGEEMYELIQSLSRGECSLLPLFVKTCFRDEIHDLPRHPQHRLSRMTDRQTQKHYKCNVCNKVYYMVSKRSYSCEDCRWFMCGSCWMTYAKQEAQQLVRARDN